jgi:hypothetical protein
MREAEVAALFDVQERTVRRWALDGRLRRVHIGGVTRYLRADIDRILAAPDEGGAATTTTT